MAVMETSTTSPNVCFNPLSNNFSLSSLKTLTCIIETSIGPYGKLKIIQNVVGSSITVTSSSQRLFHHIAIKNIFSKIITSAVKSQLKSFNDGGLICGFLASKLISNSMLLNYPLSSVGILYDYFAKLYIDCLVLESNACTFTINFSKLCHLQSVVHSLLSSKSGCVLTSDAQSHLCTLLLEAFLSVIPDSQTLLDNGNIKLLMLDGSFVKSTRLFKGILVPVTRTDLEVFLHTFGSSGTFKVALFLTSLSGDEDLPVKNIETSDSCSFSECILKHLKGIISKVITENVKVVFCQKVIHPRLKKQLLDGGVMVLDRLGAETAKYIQYISGGCANSSLVSELVYGSISNFQMETVGKNDFLLFCNDSIPFFTLVICNYNSEAASELKVVCRQVIDTLFRILKSSKVCYGAGCTEIHTAHLLIQAVKENMKTIEDETGCSVGLIKNSLHCFLRSIADVSFAIHQGSRLDFVTENTFGHLWKLHDGNFPSSGDKCQCGRIAANGLDDASWTLLSDIDGSLSSRGKESIANDSHFPFSPILDELSCKVNAFSLAFETASLLLKTTICINNSPQSAQQIV